MATSSEYRYDSREGPRDRSLRVGDKEREAVSEILRQRHLEGRLDTDEFQARLDRCLAAKTYDELDELIADFPRDATAHTRSGQPWIWRPWPLPFLFLPFVLIGASIAVGAHFVWLAFPLLFFFVVRPLFWRARGGYGPWACGPRRSTRI